MLANVWNIDSALTFAINTHSLTTGAATDADSAPTYTVFKWHTSAFIQTGVMGSHGGGTTGFYSETITLASAVYEVGRTYLIYIEAVIDGTTVTTSITFQVVSPAVGVYLNAVAVSTVSTTDAPAISLAKDSSEPHPILIITDASGTAINLSGKALRLNVWNPNDGTEALAEQTFTTADKLSIGGDDNNQVTLDHAASDVPAIVERKYDLWNVTDNYLLAQGIWSVYQTVLTATV
jgi:hypothetical protein